MRSRFDSVVTLPTEDRVVGEPQRIGEVHAVAIAWEISQELLDRMKEIAAIADTVLAEPMSLEMARAA